ncbi:multidrug ABC transporter ATP-binding protein [Actinoplanes italicus]|uniref:ABC-2 type transport system ATP-binding protein n=1 Tax=Actinoplanes italicus TaxID=113567 RepID=A0A2T0JLW1_9ACTN|nr:ATP-binding cassette domain-containing protein [Actinoplanes italicus]PRX08619.1 ABC-2 type transport system ATP-binding protein [Actinoplanes italicus]GIE36598.1 multidrug ABC transporter ATP-binding protein [Actinoplanes italicus]
MPNLTIEARELVKRYGSTLAVDRLSFTVEAGRVTGFVGPNGAGKSTTMRMMLALDRPDGGEALIGGRPYTSYREPARTVGALLDPEAVHPGRRACDHLLWMAQYNGIPRKRVDEVLQIVGLESVGRKRVGGFSLGMRQRLGIAGALLGDPGILILDEPVNGLDPEGIQWIRGFLKQLAAEGRTVLVSSHLMSELQDTADHLIILGRGRLLADTTVKELLDQTSGDQIEVRTTERSRTIDALSLAGATVAVTGPETVTVTGLTTERVVSLLSAASIPFTGIGQHRASLEDVYMAMTREHTTFAAAPEDERALA